MTSPSEEEDMPMPASRPQRPGLQQITTSSYQAARRAALNPARDLGAATSSRPVYHDSPVSRTDVDPLAGLRAARHVEMASHRVAREYIRAAREAEYTWGQIGHELEQELQYGFRHGAHQRQRRRHHLQLRHRDRPGKRAVLQPVLHLDLPIVQQHHPRPRNEQQPRRRRARPRRALLAPRRDNRRMERPMGASRATIIRKADAGELPCVIVSRGKRKKMRRFPQALIEDLALRAGGNLHTDLKQYAASWLASVAYQSKEHADLRQSTMRCRRWLRPAANPDTRSHDDLRYMLVIHRAAP